MPGHARDFRERHDARPTVVSLRSSIVRPRLAALVARNGPATKAVRCAVGRRHGPAAPIRVSRSAQGDPGAHSAGASRRRPLPTEQKLSAGSRLDRRYQSGPGGIDRRSRAINDPVAARSRSSAHPTVRCPTRRGAASRAKGSARAARRTTDVPPASSWTPSLGQFPPTWP